MVKKIIGIIIATATAAILMYFSFRRIEWGSFICSVKSSNWLFLLFSALTGVLMPVCRSLRWRLTVQPFCPSVKVSDSVLTNFAGYLVNMAVPFTHEATRCVLMHRRTGGDASYDRLIGIAIIERSCDAVCILLLFIITAVMSSGRYIQFLESRFQDGKPVERWIVMAASTVIVCIVVCIGSHLIHKHRNDNVVCLKICRFFSGIGIGLKSITELKHPIGYFLYSVLLWLIYWAQLYLGTRAMPSLTCVSAADCLILTFAVAISSLIPVPGGFGAFHFIIAETLGLLCGVPWNNGLAYATLVHESQALLIILFGSISTVILQVKRNTTMKRM